jgi:hypothetical protein
LPHGEEHKVYGRFAAPNFFVDKGAENSLALQSCYRPRLQSSHLRAMIENVTVSPEKCYNLTVSCSKQNWLRRETLRLQKISSFLARGAFRGNHAKAKD